jgi:hypothetical protein
MTWDPLAEALFVDRAAPDPEAPVTPFVAMQRVVVRLLFDPAFVDRVHRDPAGALAGLDLAPALVEQLLRNDRRLWQADRLRRTRSLKILLEEFKVSSTLALAECRRLAFLDAFFGSAHFHEAVQRRRYMALAFAAYLEEALRRGDLSSRHFAAALGLETAMARSRRLLRDARRGHDAALARVAPGQLGERWVAGPGTLAHFAPGGTLALVQRIEKYLFEVGQVPALALCDDAPRPEPLPELDEAAPVPFLLEPQPGGKVDLSEVGEGYARVIAACERPRDAAELAQLIAPYGIAAAEAREMAESLEEAGVLRRVVVGEDGQVAAGI